MLDLIFEAAAERDLAGIYARGLRTRSPAGARDFVKGIRDRCSIFQTNPGLGRLLPGARHATRLFSFDGLVTVAFRATEAEVRIVRVFPRGVDAVARLRRPR